MPGGVGPITDAWVLRNTVVGRPGAGEPAPLRGARRVLGRRRETRAARVRRRMRTYSDPLQHA